MILVNWCYSHFVLFLDSPFCGLKLFIFFFWRLFSFILYKIEAKWHLRMRNKTGIDNNLE